ncbi:hypothetical protein KQX54_013291 [Cotesia glomerata]|uniref:Uncharacterized protein n=1 Tax=Cotesia glomerata TaxID=32391 RepID=A0AAV7I357_COTGL|nr:hypothetical protein KQX54_013291 [Cotesia glomerata]
MENNRLPLICLRRLHALRSDANNVKHNWLAQVFGIINTVAPEFTPALETLDAERWKAFKAYFLEKYRKHLLEQDLRKVANANYLQIKVNRPLDGSRASFLTKRVYFQALKTLLQARIASRYYHHLLTNFAINLTQCNHVKYVTLMGTSLMIIDVISKKGHPHLLLIQGNVEIYHMFDVHRGKLETS